MSAESDGDNDERPTLSSKLDTLAQAAAATLNPQQPFPKASGSDQSLDHIDSDEPPRSAGCPWKNRRDLIGLWNLRYSELVSYHSQHGHANVPQRFGDNPELGRWVKDQRAFRPSGKLSNERIALLDELGFVWKIKNHEGFWMEKWEALREYSERIGDANPPRDEDNRLLACWVDRQRRAWKGGKLNAERVHMLNDLGFVWDPRGNQAEEEEPADSPQSDTSPVITQAQNTSGATADAVAASDSASAPSKISLPATAISNLPMSPTMAYPTAPVHISLPQPYSMVSTFPQLSSLATLSADSYPTMGDPMAAWTRTPSVMSSSIMPSYNPYYTGDRFMPFPPRSLMTMEEERNLSNFLYQRMQDYGSILSLENSLMGQPDLGTPYHQARGGYPSAMSMQNPYPASMRSHPDIFNAASFQNPYASSIGRMTDLSNPMDLQDTQRRRNMPRGPPSESES